MRGLLRQSLVVCASGAVAVALPAAATPWSAPDASAQAPGPYTGVAIGTYDRYIRTQTDRTTSNSADVFRVRFTFSFRIDASGNVHGTGTGVYLQSGWRLDGRHDGTSFNCSVPVQAPPFGVRVEGRANDLVLGLWFTLEGAVERNAEQRCGPNYTALATETTNIADSLALLLEGGARAPVFEFANLRPQTLSKLEQTSSSTERRVILHEWSFAVAGPGQPPPPDPPSGVGTPSPTTPLVLVATVGPGNTIRLTLDGRPVRILLAGRYRVVVRDRSRRHNFRFSGPGVNRSTSVAATGTYTWNVTLREGTYTYFSAPQARRLRASVLVR